MSDLHMAIVKISDHDMFLLATHDPEITIYGCGRCGVIASVQLNKRYYYETLQCGCNIATVSWMKGNISECQSIKDMTLYHRRHDCPNSRCGECGMMFYHHTVISDCDQFTWP